MTNNTLKPGDRVTATIEGDLTEVLHTPGASTRYGIRLNGGFLMWADDEAATIAKVRKVLHRKGDRLQVNAAAAGLIAARPGAPVTVDNDYAAGDTYLRVTFDRDNDLHRSQMNGNYEPNYFEPIPAVPAPRRYLPGEQYRNRITGVVWTRQHGGKWTPSEDDYVFLSDAVVTRSIEDSYLGDLVLPPAFAVGDRYACKKTNCVVTRIADDRWTCTCPDGGKPCNDAAMARWIALYGDGFTKLEFVDGDELKTFTGHLWTRSNGEWRTTPASIYPISDYAIARSLAQGAGVLNPKPEITFADGDVVDYTTLALRVFRAGGKWLTREGWDAGDDAWQRSAVGRGVATLRTFKDAAA